MNKKGSSGAFPLRTGGAPGEASEKQDEFWRISNPILWALIATFVFLGILLLFGLANTCNEDLFPKNECPPKWRHLLVAPPNEVGDTFAGLAGVLAFIWLIATVLLQAQELRAQRKEFREQRVATQDMARAMGAQASIFEDEKKQRDQARAKELLDQLLLNFANFNSVEHSPSWGYEKPNKDGSVSRNSIQFYSTFDKTASTEFQVNYLSATIVTEVPNLENLLLDGHIVRFPKGGPSPDPTGKSITFVYDLLGLTYRLLNLQGRLSEAQAERLHAFGFPRVANALEKLLEPQFWEADEQ